MKKSGKMSLKPVEKRASIGTFFKSLNPIWIVILFMIVALLLRLYHLDFNSLWLDEGATYMYSHPSNSFRDIWNITAGGEVHPPVFYWLTHIILMINISEISLRFLPVVFGVLTIPVFYYIGKLLHSELAGILSAMILTISHFHIMYSQEARSYTLLLFLSALLIYAFIKAYRTNNYKWFVCVGALAVLAFWVHFWSVIIIVPVIVSIFYITFFTKIKSFDWDINFFKDFKNFLISVGIFVAFSYPILVVLRDIYATRTSEPIYWGMRGVSLLQGYAANISNGNVIFLGLIIALTVLGIYVVFSKNKRESLFFIFVCVFGIIFSVIMSYKLPMMPRYLIPLLVVIIPSIGVALAQLYKSYKYITVIMILFICIVSVGGLTSYYSTYTHEDWRGYSEYISGLAVPGDTIIIIPNYNRNVFDFYYNLEDHGTNVVGVYNNLTEVIEKSSGSTYYVVTRDIYAVDPQEKILSWLNSNTTFVSERVGIMTFVNRWD